MQKHGYLMTCANRLLGVTYLALALCVGCGQSGGLKKVVVDGNARYDGTPIANGEIRFRPIDGTQGPVSGAPIVNGRYRAEAKGGVPVGKHSVEIEAYDTTSNSASGEMVSGGRPGARVNYLPDKYHRGSQLTVEITGDSKHTTRDFDLEK